MNEILETLRVSTDNDARKAAAARLRQIQEQDPVKFMEFIWNVINSLTVSESLRFFACTTVIAFVEESWHNVISRDIQLQMLERYMDLALHDTKLLTSPLLLRKVALIITLMAKRGAGKAALGELPPLIDLVTSTYSATLIAINAQLERVTTMNDNNSNFNANINTATQQISSTNTNENTSSLTSTLLPEDLVMRIPRLLLLVHLFVKEMESKRVGRVFPLVCNKLVPPLSILFVRCTRVFHPVQHFTLYLYLLKCAMRVFGRGVFDVSFAQFLLQLAVEFTAQIENNTSNSSNAVLQTLTSDTVHKSLSRLVEYSLKTFSTMIVNFHTRLNALPMEFFVCTNTNQYDQNVIMNDKSLLSLLSHIIISRVAVTHVSFNGVDNVIGDSQVHNTNMSCASNAINTHLYNEKIVCRAMSILTFILNAEVEESWLSQVLTLFAHSSLLPELMHKLIAGYLPDDVSERSLEMWRREPEHVVEMLLDTKINGNNNADSSNWMNDVEFQNNNESNVYMDDNYCTVISCAEQLFLACTSSFSCEAVSLRETWSIVNTLLSQGSVPDVTAALHAIGIGYYTLRANTEEKDYISFLQTKLLPVMESCTQVQGAEQPSPFIQQRVLWLVGMWCESVSELTIRQIIHGTLERILLATNANGILVVTLTTLKCIENFISDNHFSVHELTTSEIETVLKTVQWLLPYMQYPSSIKELAGLVHVMLEKTAPTTIHGEYVINVFHPAIVKFIRSINYGEGVVHGNTIDTKLVHNKEGNTHVPYSNSQRTTEANNTPKNKKEENDVDDDNDDDDGKADNQLNISTLTLSLQCVMSGIKVCRNDMTTWSLFESVIMECTLPGKRVTPWVEDEAWELLLHMSHASLCFHIEAERALMYTLNTIITRDFAALHYAVRCVAALLLLRSSCIDNYFVGNNVSITTTTNIDNSSSVISVSVQHGVHHVISQDNITHWLTLLSTLDNNAALQSSLFTLFVVIIRVNQFNNSSSNTTTNNNINNNNNVSAIQNDMIIKFTQMLCMCNEVQSSSYALDAAVLLSLCMQCCQISSLPSSSSSSTAAAAALSQSLQVCLASITSASSHVSTFVEKIVLLLDVSPGVLTTRCLHRLLRYIERSWPLQHDDRTMIHNTLSDVVARTPLTEVEVDVNSEESRPFEELLAEFVNEQYLSLNSPHFVRLVNAFNFLQDV